MTNPTPDLHAIEAATYADQPEFLQHLIATADLDVPARAAISDRAADLVRKIRRPIQVDFIGAASYGSGTVSSGQVDLVYDSEAELAGRHVLLVEDIIDSGKTIERLVPLLRERNPRTLELCALLHKHVAPPLALEPRWVGFDAPREFLVGYGLDHSENYRNLPFIGSI